MFVHVSTFGNKRNKKCNDVEIEDENIYILYSYAHYITISYGRQMLYNIYWIPVWPVQRDGEQVEDGGCAAEDVAAGPHVAQERPEHPALPDLQRKIYTVHEKYFATTACICGMQSLCPQHS